MGIRVSWLRRAFVGYVIGLLFRMPILGMLVAIYWPIRMRTGFYQHQSSEQGVHAGRWIQGCFSALGTFAKASGPVTERDIHFAETLMQRWSYGEAQRSQAIEAFRWGRSQPPERVLHRLTQSYYWMGSVHGSELIHILSEFIHELGYQHLAPLLAQWRSHLSLWHQQGAHHFKGRSRTQRPHTSREDLSWAYRALGVQPSDEHAVVKRAFRKKMAQVHPDRNPHDPKATERAQQIQKAFAMIKETRGWA